MKKVIISVTNDLTTDQRVNKVATTLINNGFSVLLVGRSLTQNYEDDHRKYACHRLQLFFNKGFLFYLEFNIRLFFFLLVNSSDILLSNDLDTLLANFIASFLKKNKLVYDSHELFTEVPELLNRPVVKAVWGFLENFLLQFIKHAYTVSDSIAQYYYKKYGVKMGVVKNVPFLKKIEHYPIKGDCKKIIYQGAINKDRGIELMISAMQYVDAKLYIVGSGDLMDEMIEHVKTSNLEHKITFLGQVHFDKLFEITCDMDLGLSFENDTCLAYRYSLPNKIFDYINAEIPLLISDLPEFRNIINKYKIGQVLNSRNPKDVSNQINHLLCVPPEKWLDQLKLAKKQFNWNVEKDSLLTFFR